MSDRRSTAEEIIEAWDANDFGGSSELSDIEAARFAVAVERDDDSWVLAANSVTEIAEIALNCLTGTEGYDEWIAQIYDMETGKPIEWRISTAVTVELTANGEQGKAAA